MEAKRFCTNWVVNYARYSAPVQCGRAAKIERNGRWYCGHHDPVTRDKARQQWLLRPVYKGGGGYLAPVKV